MVGDVKSYEGVFLRDKFFRNSGVMFISTTITGALSYFYQVYMGRALGPEQYGVFGALFAIFYMFMVISQTISTTATRFFSKFISDDKEIGFFLRGSLKRMALFGLIVSILFFVFSGKIASSLKISDTQPVRILGLILFFVWIGPINGGALRGLQRFKAVGLVSISNASFKLLFGILLVTLGFGVSGALLGVAIGLFFATLVSFLFLIPNFKRDDPHEQSFDFSTLYTYSTPVLLAMFSVSVPSNLDVMFAKYFFSAKDAGFYTSASVLGKIISFFPSAIYAVMFPMVVKRHVQGEASGAILKKGLLYTSLLTGPIALAYFLFPQLIVKIFGPSYTSALPLVAPYGLAMFFFSLTTIIMHYHLAIKNIRYIVLFVSFTLLEIVLLLTFHSSTLEMVRVLLVANFVLFIASLLYTMGVGEMTKNKNILISGFVGSYLAKQVLERGSNGFGLVVRKSDGSMRTNSVLTYILLVLEKAGLKIDKREGMHGDKSVDNPTDLSDGERVGVDKTKFGPAEVPILFSDTSKIQKLGFRIDCTLEGIINNQLNYYLKKENRGML